MRVAVEGSDDLRVVDVTCGGGGGVSMIGLSEGAVAAESSFVSFGASALEVAGVATICLGASPVPRIASTAPTTAGINTAVAPATAG